MGNAGFLDVTTPMLSPSLVSGSLLSVAFILDDLVIASFVPGPGEITWPMSLFWTVRLSVSPEIDSLATLVILLGAVGLAVRRIRPARAR
jgi:putrescine transport system permease protein